MEKIEQVDAPPLPQIGGPNHLPRQGRTHEPVPEDAPDVGRTHGLVVGPGDLRPIRLDSLVQLAELQVARKDRAEADEVDRARGGGRLGGRLDAPRAEQPNGKCRYDGTVSVMESPAHALPTFPSLQGD